MKKWQLIVFALWVLVTVGIFAVNVVHIRNWEQKHKLDKHQAATGNTDNSFKPDSLNNLRINS